MNWFIWWRHPHRIQTPNKLLFGIRKIWNLKFKRRDCLYRYKDKTVWYCILTFLFMQGRLFIMVLARPRPTAPHPLHVRSRKDSWALSAPSLRGNWLLSLSLCCKKGIVRGMRIGTYFASNMWVAGRQGRLVRDPSERHCFLFFSVPKLMRAPTAPNAAAAVWLRLHSAQMAGTVGAADDVSLQRCANDVTTNFCVPLASLVERCFIVTKYSEYPDLRRN